MKLMSMNFKSVNLISMNFKLMNLKLVVLFGAFSAFWFFLVLFVLEKSYRKKFKTDLITSFLLLLKFTLSQSFSIIINNNHQ